MGSADFPHSPVLAATPSPDVIPLRVSDSAFLLKGLLIACLATQISCCMGRNSTFTVSQVFALLSAAAVCAHSHYYLFGPTSNTRDCRPRPRKCY